MMILPFYTVSKVHLIINNTNQTIKRDSENKEKKWILYDHGHTFSHFLWIIYDIFTNINDNGNSKTAFNRRDTYKSFFIGKSMNFQFKKQW